ncbi:MAG: NAD(P)H-dependent oxidoreductase [Candidatus Marsarchaeota archaeon]|nr:NAD(P)H-dependent oxidoreductase [Candidatus Marsarchaeota archaeon]
MDGKIKILAFGGSFRKDSFSNVLLNELRPQLPQNAELETFDLSGIPMFNQDLEQNPPKEVKEFKAKIKDSDAVIIVTPEYNYSVPGFIKNAIDWASRPYGDNSFDDKPAAIISSSIGIHGGSRAQYHLRQILVFLNMHPINKPEVMIPFIGKKMENGKITDPETLQKIKELIDSLLAWTSRIKDKK